MAATCMCVDMPLDPCTFSETEDLHRAKFWPPKSNPSCALLVILGLTLGTVCELVQPPQQPHVENQIISSKPWAAGPVMLIKSTLELPSHRLCMLPTIYSGRRYVTVNWIWSGASGFLLDSGAVAFSPRDPLVRVALGDSLRLGRELVAELWMLLAMGVVPSCRGWVAGQP